MCTPAEMHVGVRERVARMCVSVSGRGQAGLTVGEGLIAYEGWGGLPPAAVSPPWVPVSRSPGEVWASKAHPSCSRERELSWVSGHLPRLISGLTPALLSPDFPPRG